MFGSGLYSIARTSTTVSVCGVHTIEAQWVGLLATWFGADVLGVLPELGGRSRLRFPHFFVAFPAYWALLLSPFCRAFGLQVGCEAWEVIRDLGPLTHLHSVRLL